MSVPVVDFSICVYFISMRSKTYDTENSFLHTQKLCQLMQNFSYNFSERWSQWCHCLMCVWCWTARTLGSWFRIPLEARMCFAVLWMWKRCDWSISLPGVL